MFLVNFAIETMMCNHDIPIDRNCTNTEKTDPDIAISKEWHENTEKSHVSPTTMDKSYRIKWQYQKTKYKVCHTKTVMKNLPLLNYPFLHYNEFNNEWNRRIRSDEWP